jgi:hypothetical protein
MENLQQLKDELNAYKLREEKLKVLIGELVENTDFGNYSDAGDDEDEAWQIGDVYYNRSVLAQLDIEEAGEDVAEELSTPTDVLFTLQEYIAPILNELNYLVK